MYSESAQIGGQQNIRWRPPPREAGCGKNRMMTDVMRETDFCFQGTRLYFIVYEMLMKMICGFSGI